MARSPRWSATGSRSPRIRRFDSISPSGRYGAALTTRSIAGTGTPTAGRSSGAVATIEVRQADGPQNPRLEVTIAESAIGRGTEPAARAALTLLLGLDVDVSPFVAMASEDPLLRGPVDGLRGLRPPRFPSVFEALLNAIACQQLSLEVGIHLLKPAHQQVGLPFWRRARRAASLSGPPSTRRG